jgi:hypothetical protein
MAFPERDIEKECDKQKEKLILLGQELQIQKVEKHIMLHRTEEKRLRDDVRTLEATLEDLVKQRSAIQEALRQWKPSFHSRTLKWNIRLLEIQLKIKGKNFKLLRLREKLAAASQYIKGLEISGSVLKQDIYKAKADWRVKWPKEEGCTKTQCVVQSKELCYFQAEFEKSKEKIQQQINDLNTIKAQFKKSKKKIQQQDKELCDSRDQFDRSRGQIQQQSIDLDAIQVKILEVQKRLQRKLAEVELSEAIVSPSINSNSVRSNTRISPAISTSTPTKAAHERIASATTVLSTPTTIITDNPPRNQLLFDSVEAISTATEALINHVKNPGSKLKEIEDKMQFFKDKVEQMQPLYRIGLATRKRKFELDMKDIKDSRPDWNLVNLGNEAAHNGRALADATMFMDFCELRRPYPGEFEDQYNKVPASVVWEHRNFSRFHDILDWHLDMRQFGRILGGYKSSKFDENFNKLFSKIYPSFEISSNECIAKDPSLTMAYNRLWTEHHTGDEMVRERRKYLRDCGR